MSILDDIDLENWGDIIVPPQLVDEMFLKLRESPLEVFGVVIDCDEDSMDTMRQAFKHFDSIPLGSGSFSIKDGEKNIMWRLANNTIHYMTKNEFGIFLSEAEEKKAIRTAKLYDKKRQFKDSGGTYAEVFADWL